MTLDDVKARVKEIEARIRDDESAHLMGDVLYVELLKAIADGQCLEPAECAKEALKVQEMDFSRWYA